MPTAARLVAAICFGSLAWFLTELVKPLLQPGMHTEYFAVGNAMIGVIIGWSFMGRRIGDGFRAATGIGLSTAGLLTVAAIFAHASIEMYHLSINGIYSSPMDAIVAIFEISIDYGALIATPAIIGSLVIGGCLGGWITEWAGRQWS